MINKITEQYSKLHTNTTYTYNDKEISFDGSQIVEEFSEAWNKISDYYKTNKVSQITFLEIGAYRGLWAIAFAELCKSLKVKGKYVTITLMDNDTNNIHLHKSLDYVKSLGIDTTLINGNTLDENALDSVKQHSSTYNIVFIDGGHTYDVISSDIQKFVPLCEDILLFHDIRPKQKNQNNGVYQAIQDASIELDEEIVSNEEIMGIGVKYIK
jgi:hypothetical protein